MPVTPFLADTPDGPVLLGHISRYRALAAPDERQFDPISNFTSGVSCRVDARMAISRKHFVAAPAWRSGSSVATRVRFVPNGDIAETLRLSDGVGCFAEPGGPAVQVALLLQAAGEPGGGAVGVTGRWGVARHLQQVPAHRIQPVVFGH